MERADWRRRKPATARFAADYSTAGGNGNNDFYDFAQTGTPRRWHPPSGMGYNGLPPSAPFCLMPTRPRRATTTAAITADFPGARCPAGSIIHFAGPDGRPSRGTVTRLRARTALVTDDRGTEWSVPYTAIVRVESAPPSECTLKEVAELAQRLLEEHLGRGHLGAGWTIGFDLSPARAGVCRYREKRIDLSVSYCLKATRAEIEDTARHEIAHAIVGPKHHHDAVWKAQARAIGCVGERCHRVQHTIPRWLGECGCGRQWFRQTLQRRVMHNRACPQCRGRIQWRRNTGGAMPADE